LELLPTGAAKFVICDHTIEAEDQRAKTLQTFPNIYSPRLGKGPVLDYFAQTDLDVLKGAFELVNVI
jgi:hypothetical protein